MQSKIKKKQLKLIFLMKTIKKIINLELIIFLLIVSKILNRVFRENLRVQLN